MAEILEGFRLRVTEPKARSKAHFVPLPAPNTGLADLLAEVVPPGALTLSTPFVRVPVIAPPVFTDEQIEAHAELAVRRWQAQWTQAARRRVLRALNGDRETVGGRYESLVATWPWLMLSLEGSGIGWEAALLLAERLTTSPVGGGPRISDLPDLGDPRSGYERVLTPYRRLAATVLGDIGTTSPIRALLGDLPEDENRNPSRLVQAAAACGITRTATANPSRAARSARSVGRQLLHDLGAWPWVCVVNGELAGEWWTEAAVGWRLEEWLRRSEAEEVWARRRRRAAAASAGLEIP